ncbi:MAG: cellulase family glycosylhydrolase [Treponema sp.]|jgi:endoglucanase|nr:cellulase family glycosylhydrolase [Treponema sp.]
MYRQTAIPRWRGFNLLGVYVKGRSPGHYNEEDFQMMADWGFDFVRLPLSYRFWTEEGDPFSIQEEGLAPIDEAVRWGERYGIHVNIAFHRGPGYCIHDRPDGASGFQEPFDLWKDDDALECFVRHWVLFAKRYRGEGAGRLSFNMLNESSRASVEDHGRVMRAAVRAVHEISPDRLCVVDGLSGGNFPLADLGDLAREGCAQSCRGYIPAGVSHYRAPWVDRESQFPYPVWPGGLAGDEVWTRERLDAHYDAWAGLGEAFEMGIHCGEGGSNHNCPHDVALRWLEDLLSILKSHNIGYAQWEFSGDFGVLDSNRADVVYEEYRGRRLDKKMLDLLRAY